MLLCMVFLFIPLYEYTRIFYPFTSWWTFGLFSVFAYYEWSCCEQLCTSLFVDIFFPPILGKFVDMKLLSHIASTCFYTSDCHTLLKWLSHFIFPKCMSILVAMHLHQHLILSIFKILIILVGVMSYSFSLHFMLNIIFSCTCWLPVFFCE